MTDELNTAEQALSEVVQLLVTTIRDGAERALEPEGSQLGITASFCQQARAALVDLALIGKALESVRRIQERRLPNLPSTPKGERLPSGNCTPIPM